MSANQKGIDAIDAEVARLSTILTDATTKDIVDEAIVNAMLARDLLELHDRTGISLDNWEAARSYVERYVGPIKENGV